ncbi:MAG: hypothetical protein KKA60_05535 [Proteobacteria bacterium]|nr:hypothetical protein [Pseudomonadota bacterium]
MGKVFRPSNRESRILNRIESSKEHARRQAIQQIPECMDPLANAMASKLVENGIVETTSQNKLEEDLRVCLDNLTRADEFDIEYKTTPFRRVVPNPHTVSLYLTAYVIEKLIDHKHVVDIYGDDATVYAAIHQQVKRFLP